LHFFPKGIHTNFFPPSNKPWQSLTTKRLSHLSDKSVKEREQGEDTVYLLFLSLSLTTSILGASPNLLLHSSKKKAEKLIPSSLFVFFLGHETAS
jgi:hypothetical protein